MYDGSGDYLLVTDGSNTIQSRWFIIDAVRNRSGQYSLTLRRDLLADYKDYVLSNICFVEKAMLSKNDPMLFNSENMTFNQVKKKEWLLKDASGTAWIVGYLNRSLTEDKAFNIQLPAYYDYSFSTIDDFQAYQTYKSDADNLPRTYDSVSYQIIWNFDYTGEQSLMLCDASGYFTKLSRTAARSTSFTQNPQGNATVENFLTSELSYNLRKYLNASNNGNIFSNSNLLDIKQYDNKVVRIGTETFIYYRMSVKELKHTGVTEDISNKDFPALYNTVFNSNYITDNSTSSLSKTGLSGKNDYTEFYLQFEDITSSYVTTVNLTIPATRNQLIDAPYDMFCIPVEAVTLGGTTYAVDNVQGICSSIYTQLGGGSQNSNIFDIQYLPYCPIEKFEDIQLYGLTSLIANYDYTFITSNNVTKSIIFYAKKASFTNKIAFDFNIDNLTALNLKVASECEMYRLCSPNYNGVFEFNPYKNGGIKYFEINCTYKPYSPYIHINPNWGNLYGSDFNDARGLILGGDFSIAALSSAWEQYQLQNKNYEAIFNREIQSMDLKNNIQREKEMWQAGTGIATGSVAGAFTGSKFGGVYGLAAGAVVGGIASTVGGARDITLNEQLRNEALDYSKDMYAYNLGNIQALPTSLSKSSAFDINNKIFPFLEQYTATPEEEQAFFLKLLYNGMTVMRIGSFGEFLTPEESYMKGKLIRIGGISDDYHICNEIGKEANLGFFITGNKGEEY